MDREKVIRAIEGCINFDDYCNDCVYDGCIYVHGSCEKDLLADALALLKEQEPVETEIDGGGSTWYHVCGDCHGVVDDYDSYCKHCGRKLKHD